ncbi:MAG: metal-sulfur cluster assembly factor [Candidatus Eremiobacteraeota bacterium]|nr:metal-sulfur cluster assembly factor [Candidatus Eremiobacteraeota bacterium]
MTTDETPNATSSQPSPAGAATSDAAASEEHVVTEEQVREALRGVVDPEIGLDMVSLGLLYGVAVDGPKVKVTMTLTTPACPVGPMFVAAVKHAVMALPGVSDCDVDVTFSPPWDPRTMASDEVKLQMGFYY